MKTLLLNPLPLGRTPFIREGRCMQAQSSWASVWPPLSLSILAALAEPYGEVRLIDCNVEPFTLNQLITAVRNFNPRILFLNTGFPSIESDLETARHLKQALPELIIVGFGLFFTLLKEEALHAAPGLDAAIVGEPESAAADILGALSRREEWASLPGLVSRIQGQPALTPVRPVIADLDAIPHPARAYVLNSKYRMPHNGKVFTLINVARGCPYHCTFCAAPLYYGSRLRKHSTAYVLKELQECLERYHIDNFLFWEEIFTLDRDYVAELCSGIQSARLPVAWATTTRCDLVDEELVRMMKTAGCFMLGLGIESASQEILDAAKKGEQLESMIKAVRICRAAGMLTMGHFIFGLPGETAATAAASIKFALTSGLDYIQCYCAVPYPGTELGAVARERNWIRPSPWSKYDLTLSIMRNAELSPEDVNRFRDRAYRSFYLRPGYILRQLQHMPLKQILTAGNFLRWIRVRR